MSNYVYFLQNYTSSLYFTNLLSSKINILDNKKVK
jgi:hypothetical protein